MKNKKQLDELNEKENIEELKNQVKKLRKEKFDLNCKIKVLQGEIQDLEAKNNALVRSLTFLNNFIEGLKVDAKWLTRKVQLYKRDYELDKWEEMYDEM